MKSAPHCSVIVPVYNVSAYLHQCIRSLISLDNFEDCEIILIDDGSTDNSGDICDIYASKYGNISVIHQQNGGLSAARNTGIKAAAGKYLFFVDSDDFVAPDFTSAPCKIFDENPDIDGIHICLQFTDEEGIPLKKIIGGKRFTPHAPSWIYKRDFIVQHNLLFDTSMRMAEDVDFTLRALINNPEIYTLNKPLYFYRQRHTSIMASAHTLERNLFHLKIVEKLLPQFYHASNARLPYFFKKRFTNLIIIFLKNLAKSTLTPQELALANRQFKKCMLCTERHPNSIAWRPAIFVASRSLPLYLSLRRHHIL